MSWLLSLLALLGAVGLIAYCVGFACGRRSRRPRGPGAEMLLVDTERSAPPAGWIRIEFEGRLFDVPARAPREVE